MDTPDPAAPGTSLSRDAYRHVIFTLRNAMPAVPDTGRDPAEALAWRDHAAVTQVAGFCPANPAEAAMAAEFVAAHAQAMAVLGEAQDPRTPPDWVPRCRAQAACMMRLAQGAVRALMRMQAARERRAGEQAAADWAADHAAEMARARPTSQDAGMGLSHADGSNPAEHYPETVMSETPSPVPAGTAAPAGTHEARQATHDPATGGAKPAPGRDAVSAAGAYEARETAHEPAKGAPGSVAPGSALPGSAAVGSAAPGSAVPEPASGAGDASHPPRDTLDRHDAETARDTSLPLAPPRPGLRQPLDGMQPPLAA